MTDLVFPDQQGYADLATLVRRARQADPDAAVRLQVTGAVLRVWVGVLPGTGLLADGAAVGVRGIELANEDAGGSASEAGALDLVCASAALSDRFAYDGVGASRLSVPPASTYAAWAGALPAIAGWSSIGAISAQALIDAARAGIAEIAQGVDAGQAGAAAGSRARAVPIPAGVDDGPVNGADDQRPTGFEGVPAGAAFAAYVLGFLPEPSATVRVWRSGRWVRLQTAVGHVVARP